MLNLFWKSYYSDVTFPRWVLTFSLLLYCPSFYLSAPLSMRIPELYLPFFFFLQTPCSVVLLTIILCSCFTGPILSFISPRRWIIIFFFGHASQRVGWWFPDQELNPDPQQWEWGILTTGLPGHSLDCNSFDDNSYIIFIPPSSFLLCLFWPLPSVLDDFLKRTLALVFCSHFREQNQTVNLWLCMLRQQLELDMKQQTGSK